MMLLGLLALLGLPFLAIFALLEAAEEPWRRFLEWIKARRDRRVDRVEAELDRKQDELRATILHLANALGAEAHEARKALIRESYLASGRLSKDPSGS
ncbi:hypothetical protein [Agromyces bauzanensis]